jgi:hypothetical protein
VTAPVFGTLEAIHEGQLVFSGKKWAIAPGAFLTFGGRPAPLQAPAFRLHLRQAGVLGATEIESADGGLLGQTSIGSRTILPRGMLRSIAFYKLANAPAAGSIAVIFRNGDELQGALLATEPSGAVHWRLANGTEAVLKAERIAGIHFVAEKQDEGKTSPLIETTTGDRLAGKIESLDDEKMVIRNEVLGSIAIPAKSVCAAIMHEQPGAVGANLRHPQWLEFDGSYFARPTGERSVQASPIGPFVGTGSFELSFEVATGASMLPAFTVTTGDKDRPRVFYRFTDGEVNYMVREAGRGVLPNRKLSISEQLKGASPRLNVRAFFDASTGKAPFFINGIPAGEIGYHTGPADADQQIFISLQMGSITRQPIAFSDIRLRA